jgi:N-acetylglutamate synthase
MTAAPPASDAVAAAFASAMAYFAPTLQNGWAREFGRALAVVTAVPATPLNGVWAVHEDTPAEDIDAALEAVAASGLPHCLEVRPACRETAAVVAERHGLIPEPEIPLMATAGPVDGPRPEGLVIQQLEPEQAALHSELAGPAFEAPPELFAELITPAVLTLPGVRGYLGAVAGEPVVTAMATTLDEAVGIFNVATPAAHRRRGYGAAVTARAAADGFAAGASWAWLQSSEAGYGLYERLGFTTLERWPGWVTPD